MGQDRFARRQGTVRGDHHRRPALSWQPGRRQSSVARRRLTCRAWSRCRRRMSRQSRRSDRASGRSSMAPFDVGFSYTRSSHIAQLNINTNTVVPQAGVRSSAHGVGHGSRRTATTARAMTGARSRRRTIRFRGQRLFVAAGASFESNESLGLLLRSQGAVRRGPAACQHQSGAGGDRRRARGQRRAKRRRGSHAEPGGHRHVQAVVPTGTIARKRTSTLPSSTTRASPTGAASASSSTPAPSARSGRMSSCR